MATINAKTVTDYTGTTGTINAAGSLGSNLSSGNLSGALDSTDSLLNQISGKVPGLGASLYAQITPDMRNALNTGADIVRSAGPAISFMEKVAGGSSISPMEAISAMSATVGAINPLAGAALFAAASLVNGLADGANQLFQALGLQNPVPHDEQVIGGYIIGKSPIPTPPNIGTGEVDPTWIRWEDMIRLDTPSSGATPHFQQRVIGATDVFSMKMPTADKTMWRLMWTLAPNWGVWQPGYPNVYPKYTQPKNDFEKFLYPLLQRNMEFWYNANAYMNPRDLVENAAFLWNAKHAGDVTKTYRRDEAHSDSIVGFIESGIGDISGLAKRGKDLTVNLGAYVPPSIPAVPGPSAKDIEKQRIDEINAASLAGNAAGNTLISQLKNAHKGPSAAKAAFDKARASKAAPQKPKAKTWTPIRIALASAAVLGIGAILKGRK